jgi:1-acyl-sn-glycerol-3-phosphate acyltransferase
MAEPFCLRQIATILRGRFSLVKPAACAQIAQKQLRNKVRLNWAQSKLMVAENMLLYIRALWRITRVGLHLAYGLLLAGTFYPVLSLARRRRVKQRWSRNLLKMFGVQLECTGSAAGGARLLVSNHISWLDIFVINAVEPVVFVSKNDILGWPLIGTLSRHTETIYLERGCHHSAHKVSQQIAAALSSGTTVAIFPEGTTTSGEDVLPFRGALLEGALRAGVPVQPLALRYATRQGERSAAAVYCGTTSLIESIWAIVTAPSLHAHLARLAPLPVSGRDRRTLAMTSQFLVRSSLVLLSVTRTASHPDGSLPPALISAHVCEPESAVSTT